MNIREMLEQQEYMILKPYASFSDKSRGREIYEEPCDMRPAYQRDRDRILHCKSFRRLKHKTQVFLAPAGDHYRTRLTHTLEVSQIARTIARSLGLNQELTEAIALGHDLGHTPFGHVGEAALNEVCSDGFAHYKQSIRVVEVLENKGAGLNLTWEVRDGIYNHRTSGSPSTLEGKIVRLSDKIAYISHDVDDAIRAGMLNESMLPSEITDVLGTSVKERLNKLVHDIILNSMDKPEICMSPDIEEAMMSLRRFMFDNVYFNKKPKENDDKAKDMVKRLFEYYIKHIDEVPEEVYAVTKSRQEPQEMAVCDYIAGMTDGYAVSKFENLFIPKSWDI
ncbi:MAG: deoxyguanosinetriphosphate triphosphohydrolase [Lachnospiraceae bacterium]|nr:deoxyguanosinetriphosphate triphosphohydrolase [Lachnospiraceae bacterium]